MTVFFQSGFPFEGLELTIVQAEDFVDYPVTIEGSGTPNSMLYTDECAINGNTGVYVTSATGDRFIRRNFAGQPELWYRAYVYMHKAPVGTAARIGRFRSSGGDADTIAGLYINPAGQYFIGNGATIDPIWTSTNTYENNWARIEWRCYSPATGAGEQRVRIYSGSNLYGDSTTGINFEQSPVSVATAFAGGIQSIAFGVVGTDTITARYTMDAVIVTDNGWPGSIKIAPVSAFVPDRPAGQAPLTVTFTNQSLNATSYSWDFGDGSAFVTTTNTSHTYTDPGNYFVTLTASGNDIQRSSTQQITVLPGGGGGGGDIDWEISYTPGTVGDTFSSTDPLLTSTGTAPAVYTDNNTVKGSRALSIDGRTGSRLYTYEYLGTAPTQVFFRNYVNIAKIPVNEPMVLAVAYQDGAAIGRVTVNQHGKWALWRGEVGRWGNLTAESEIAVSSGQYVRMEWRINLVDSGNKEQILRVYVGNAKHTGKISLVLRGPVTGTAIDAIGYGIEQACNGRVFMDQTALGSDTWIGATAAPNADGIFPVAGFTASKLTIAKGDAVQFTNYSTGSPTSYNWQFGNGTGSTVNPLRTYANGGTFNVRLTATNLAEAVSDPASLTVTALDPARGKAVPYVRVGGLWRTESGSGGMVKSRISNTWDDGTFRVFKDGFWSSNDPLGTVNPPATGGGWGVGTASTGIWYGSSLGQSNNANTAYNLAIEAFEDLDVIHVYGNWAATWAGVSGKAKLAGPKVIQLNTTLTNSDFQALSENDTVEKAAIYARMVAFCDTIPTDRRLWLCGDHEPENDLTDTEHYAYPFLTPSTWRESQRMWQDAVTESREKRTTNKQWLKYLTTLMGWTFDPSSGRNINAWTVNNVDCWGFDVYNIGVMRLARDYAIDSGMQWMIPEWGDANANDFQMRDWMVDYWVAATQETPVKPKGLMYWQGCDRCGTASEWNGIITPETHPESTRMWSAVCTTGYPPTDLWPLP